MYYLTKKTKTGYRLVGKFHYGMEAVNFLKALTKRACRLYGTTFHLGQRGNWQNLAIWKPECTIHDYKITIKD